MGRKSYFAAGAIIALAAAGMVDDARAETVWTQATINRPLTMPVGTFYAGGLVSANPTPAAPMESDADLFSTHGAGVSGGYGITDSIEVYGGYGLDVNPGDAGLLRLGAGYAAVRGAFGGKLQVVARGDLGFDAEATDIAPLLLGAQIQYMVNDKFAVISPGNHFSFSFVGDANDKTPITFGFPVGVLVQPTQQVFGQLDTNFVSLSIYDSDTQLFGADFLPVNATFGYTPSKTIDIGLTLSDDLRQAGDTFAAMIFARYYGGV